PTAAFCARSQEQAKSASPRCDEREECLERNPPPPGSPIQSRFINRRAAKREILPGVEHRQHRYLNNRTENSHQPTRQREWYMQPFKSPGQAQRFLSAYGPIVQHFRPCRRRFSAPAYRQEIEKRFHSWQEITVTGLAA